MKRKIVEVRFDSYDGRYPAYCSGDLNFTAIYDDGTEIECSWAYCLRSGGGLLPESDYETFVGDWEVCLPDFPDKTWEDFTPEVLKMLTKMVNENITPKGCCGGCMTW